MTASPMWWWHSPVRKFSKDFNCTTWLFWSVFVWPKPFTLTRIELLKWACDVLGVYSDWSRSLSGWFGFNWYMHALSHFAWFCPPVLSGRSGRFILYCLPSLITTGPDEVQSLFILVKVAMMCFRCPWKYFSDCFQSWHCMRVETSLWQHVTFVTPALGFARF